MSSLVIVALPAEDEIVYKVSSEKVPHLTLMYLGEATEDKNAARMAEFVEHALKIHEHGPFYLDVDYRGELGDDKADVLFFSGGWEAKWIKTLRGQLLKQADIRAAYDAADKFPDWLPHLTLGYPDAPAKKLDDDRKIYGVQFDRIAVWTGNYEGPEFRLKWPERNYDSDSASPLYMSSVNQARIALGLAPVDELTHFGVKGMRWGVRKAAAGAKAVDRGYGKLADAAEDRKFTTRANSSGNVTKLIKQAANKTKQNDLPKINKKYEGKAKTSNQVRVKSLSRVPVQKKYRKEVADAYLKNLNEVASSTTSGTGRLRYEIVPPNRLVSQPSASRWRVKAVKVQHADLSMDEFDIVLEFDDNGFIVDFKEEAVAETELAQAVELGEEFVLEHFGIKGMRWGVRKEQAKTGLRKIGRGIGRAADALGEHFYETSVYSDVRQEAVHNQVAKEIDSKIYRLQTAPKYRGKNLKTDHSLKTEYEQDVAKVTHAAYKRAVKDNFGENTKGTKEARYVDDARGARIEIRDKKTGEIRREAGLRSVQEINADRLDETLEQAATDTVKAPDITIPFKLDDNGQIKAVGRVKTSAAQDGLHDAETMVHMTTAGEAFILEHYGIKGMRWGVRRAEPTAVTPQATSLVPHGAKRKTKIQTEGGENHPAAEDAIKVAKARVKLQKSGPSALSNQELQEVANRMRLEQQVVEMNRGGANRFIRKLLGDQGKETAKQVVRESVKAKVNPEQNKGKKK